MKLAGKVASTVGTSLNIGGGMAEGMADKGAQVVCVDVQPDYARACAASISKRGGQAIGVARDVTDAGQVQAAVERAKAVYGGIDILLKGAVIFNTWTKSGYTKGHHDWHAYTPSTMERAL